MNRGDSTALSNIAPRRQGFGLRRRGLRPVGRPSDLFQGVAVDRRGRHRRPPDRLVGCRSLRSCCRSTGTWSEVREALRNRRTLVLLTVTALLIGGNWLLYVYAVNSGHILAGKPRLLPQPARERSARPVRPQGAPVLAAMGCGRAWPRPVSPRLQSARLASCGSASPCASSFATYGLLRKIAPVDAVAGLGDRDRAAASRSPLGWLGLGLRGRRLRSSAHRSSTSALLARRGHRHRDAAAAVHRRRAAPALLDAGHAAVPRPDAAIPDRGLALRRAVHDCAHAIAFGAIWTALALYVVALVRHARASVTLPE